MDADTLAAAARLLDEGVSYRETAATLGINRSALSRLLPGRGWTYRQAGQFRAATRRASRLAGVVIGRS